MLLRHVSAEIVEANAELLGDVDRLTIVATAAAVVGGSAVLGSISHRFESGAACVLLLVDAHMTVHTWPDHGRACIDVVTRGDVDPWPIAADICERIGGRHEARSVETAGV